MHTGIRITPPYLSCSIHAGGMSEYAEVSVNFIGNVERGESAASVKTLRRIAKAVGADLKDLFDFPDEDADEIIDQIMAILRSGDWEIDELRMVRNLRGWWGRGSRWDWTPEFRCKGSISPGFGLWR